LGETEPDATLRLDGKPVRIGRDGFFLIGFGRDAKAEAVLDARFADGAAERRTFRIERRRYDIQRVEGLPPAQVSPPPETLARIRDEAEALRLAQDRFSEAAWYRAGFAWPVAGRLSGVYGSQRILNGEPRAPHLGVDIAAPEGVEVRAPAAGTVVFARPELFFTGNTLVLDHGHGLTSLYAHLSAFAVREGERVEKGAAIGRVGATGRATGPNLHWGVSLFEVRLDPALLAGPMAPAATAAPR
jgi:murein DD-endopeptidase MepM/ murein hydrolase activator NlpD